MANEVVRLYKVTAMPGAGSLTPNSIYYVAPPGKPVYFEVYMTGTSATTVKRLPTTEDIQALIDAAVVAAAGGDHRIADTIALRDAIADKTDMMQVYVVDATGDPSVASGGALYMWRNSNSTWIKLSEAESLDFTVTWATITDGPSSTPAQIDAAVAASHAHTNKTQLDKIGEVNGLLAYDGNLPATAWSTAAW